ncbi:MAG: heme-binding domain-containing protein [Saprospiraceae bacterium]|nr:heme-binding domain-containing protein [Saprospiraceae bacterium]
MLKKILGALLIALLLIQFIRPAQDNPPTDQAQSFEQVASPPAEITSILKSACYDCHSNETVYPWYSKIAPVSWWLANHINEGREHLNFSVYGQVSAEDKGKVMEEIAEVIQKNEMPLASYTWLHPEAKLSDAQKNTLVQWANSQGVGQHNGGEENEHEE